MTSPTSGQEKNLSNRDRIEILLEEYRSLNSLLLFRLTAMDRRLPLSAGLVAAAIATMLTLPPDARTAVLVATPPLLLWLVRTTVQHARAKEDHLRRIHEIEDLVNRLAGEELLVFQSRHPNRGKVAAGRTGNATVLATATGAVCMLFLCLFLFLNGTHVFPTRIYIGFVLVIVIDVVVQPLKLSRYRYQRAPGIEVA